jgi:hypothetical protein
MAHAYLNYRKDLSASKIAEMLKLASDAIRDDGVAVMGKIWRGDSFSCLNAMDYLTEEGYLIELTAGKDVWGQNRVYTAGPRMPR